MTQWLTRHDALYGMHVIDCVTICQDVSINKYFDDPMLLELAKQEAAGMGSYY